LQPGEQSTPGQIPQYPTRPRFQKAGDAEYLDTCRKKRNIVEYERAGSISVTEADELLAFAAEFRGVVTNWLKNSHPTLLAGG
jgi:hypothetical protein